MSVKITTKEQAQKFLDQYDDFLFDCDGVLWQGNHLLPHVPETLQLLRDNGKRLIFVTNNSTKSRQAYTKKFEKFGIKVNKEEIFGSAYSAAVYLQKVVKFPKDKKVLVVGETGLEEELTEAGIPWLGATDAAYNRVADDEALSSIVRDKSIGAVLCGLDFHINYYKIANALIQLQDPETLFLATNIDSTYPSLTESCFPEPELLLEPLRRLLARKPVALGKPSQAMMDCIKAQFEFDPSKACMVGDRLNTDMRFGEEGGLGTLFVLSGVDTEESIKKEDAVAKPKYYADKLGDLYELLKN